MVLGVLGKIKSRGVHYDNKRDVEIKVPKPLLSLIYER